MTGRYRLQKQVKRQDIVKADEQVLIPGTLGMTIGGSQKVEVPNRIGYVYVRIRGDLSEMVQAYNDKVALVYDLPVLLIRDKVDKNKYRIYDRDISRYIYWGNSNYIPEHGLTHTFDPNNPGKDIVWVWGKQMMPLAATPSGTVGGPNVVIQEAVWYQSNDWHYISTTGSPNLIPDYKPTGSSASVTLLYIDENGNPALEVGTSFDASYTGTSQIIPYLPAMPETYGIPVAGIRLLSGTTSIGWENIYDLRPWLIGDGFIPTGTFNKHTIEFNGTPLPDRQSLNVLGIGLIAYDDGSKTILSGTVSGGGVGTFLELTDTPVNYIGAAGQLVVVNSGEDALEFLPNTGTASTLSFPAWRIPYSDISGTLVTDDKFTNTAVYDYPSIRIGGVGDIESADEGFALNLISTESSPLGLWGYRGEYFEPELYFYCANGTEVAPTAILKEANLGSILFYGYTNNNHWAPSSYIENIASEDFDDIHRASYLQFRGMQTGSAGGSPAFAVQQNHAKFNGSVQVPYNGAYYIGGGALVNRQYDTTVDYEVTGSWRISTSLNNMVFQYHHNGIWNDALSILATGTVSAHELSYLQGVIGPIQDQIFNHVMLNYPYGIQIMNTDQAGRSLVHRSSLYTQLFFIDGSNSRVQIGTNTAGAIADFRDTSIVFNEASGDIDFRVESNSYANMLKIDAGLDAVQIGNTVAGAIADFRATAISFNGSEADVDFDYKADVDPELFHIDAGINSGAGAVWIGGTPADTTFRFSVRSSGTSSAMFANFDTAKAGGGAGMIGYSIPGTGAALAAGNRCGFFLFGGSKNVNKDLSNTAGIAAFAEENWTDASTPSYFRIDTTASGATARAERLRVNMAGHVTPGANKTQNLGSSALRWNTLYQGTSTAAGTSRTFSSKKICPVCNTKMIRGSGSLCILGEDRDYEVAMCPNCGALATEELQHLPKENLSKRVIPPKIEFLGFHVFEMSGNSRKVRVDFKYKDEIVEWDENERVVVEPAILNSTYLGEEELEIFLSLNEEQREKFLLDLGQREWDALEEIKLMKEEVDLLQTQLNGKIKSIKYKNLLKG